MAKGIQTLDELREMISEKLKHLCEKTGADVATYHFYDEVQDQLIFPVGFGLQQEKQFLWLPSKRGPAARVLALSESVFAEKAEYHPDFRGRFTILEGIKSGVAVPFLQDGKKISIVFVNFRRQKEFSTERKTKIDELVLSAQSEIFKLITPNMQASMQFDRGLRREHDVLQEIAFSVSRLLHDTEAVIWLVEETNNLVARAHSEFSGFSSNIWGSSIRLFDESNFITEAFLGQQVVSSNIVDEVWPGDSFHQLATTERSWKSGMAFPLADLGVLVVYTVGHSGLTSNNKAIAQAFANQAKSTIRSHSRIIALEALSDVANKLNFDEEKPEKILEAIVKTAKDVMMADEVDLIQRDPDLGCFLDETHIVVHPSKDVTGMTTPRETGGSSAFVRDHGVIKIPDIDTVDPNLEILRHKDFKALFALPLEANNQILGVLFFNYLKPRQFTRDDITVGTIFGEYAASTLYNYRLITKILQKDDELKEYSHSLEVLNEIGRELTAEIKSEAAIIELVHQQASRLMNMSDSYIALFDKETNEIRFPLMLKGGDAIEMLPRQFGKGGTEEIIKTGKPLFHRTKAEARVWYDQHEDYLGEIQSSWIGVPIAIAGRVLGVIAAYDWQYDNVYGDADLEVMQVIASQTAIALENARKYYDVFQQLVNRNHSLEVLNEIGRELTAEIKSEAAIIELVHQQASRLMNMSDSYIALFDKETNEIRFPLMLKGGDAIEMLPRQFGKGGTEEIIKTGKPLFHRTKAEARAWYDQHEDFVGEIASSWIGVPIATAGGVLGVIAAYDWQYDNVYGDADLEVLQVIASQTAIALENANLYNNVIRNLEERVNDLETVQEIVSAINTESDLKILLQTVAESIHTLVSADDVAIYQYDDEYREFYLQVKLDHQDHPIPELGGASEKVINLGKIVFADDAQKDAYVRGAFVRDRGVKSCMAAPLIVNNECIGILYVNFFKVRHIFTEEEKRILTIIANQAAGAIRTIGLLHLSNIQLNTVLRSIGAAKECETLNDLLSTYLRTALDEIGAERGTIQLLDDKGDKLVVRAIEGSVFQREYQRISIGDGITGRSARQKNPIYVPDVQLDPHYLDFFGDIRSELAVPFMVNNEPLGVLNAEHSRVNAFDINKRRLFELFAAQASVLIKERMQLEDAQNRRVQSEVEANSAKMTQIMSHNMKNYLGGARSDMDEIINQIDLTDEQQRVMGRVDASMQRCIDITMGMFKPYRPGKLVDQNPLLLVANAVDLVGQPSDISIENRVPKDLPKIRIEANNAVDFFHEILTNAIKAVKQHICEGKIDRGLIIIDGKMGEIGYVKLFFTNNGPAIPETQREKIFERFSGEPDESDSESLGLGLWGARTFFQRLGGNVELVESNQLNTTFVVLIPSAGKFGGTK